jgi:ribosomal protein S18 acetylase RimI-like enzyme
LLDATLAHVRSLGDIRQVTLGVTASNEGASALYKSRGFVRYGLEPDYLRINGEYHAMEHLILML